MLIVAWLEVEERDHPGEITRPLNNGDAEQAEAVSLLECVTTQNEYNMM